MPWTDAYMDPDAIPMQAYFEHGWTFECFGDGCDQPIVLDTLGSINEQGYPLCTKCAKKQKRRCPHGP